MEVKQLLKNKLYRASALLGLSLLSFTSQAQTNVTVDANAEWLTGVICFDNVPAETYLWYAGDFPLDALKTTLNTGTNTVTLYPNYSAYSATDPYWSNGDMGNKILLTLSYVEGDQLVGQDFTFSGKVTSHTLAAGYTAKAFIKVMDATYATTIAEILQELPEDGNFTLAYNATNLAAGSHIQYGFQVKGINGNPAFEAQNGNIAVTSDTPQEPEEPGATNVTIGATTPLLNAYVNWFQLDGTTYVGGSTWGMSDIKTVLNSDGSIDLHPNFSVWGNGANSEWVNNGVGQRVLEGNTYIDNEALLGETVTFSGQCLSNTLTNDYDGIAFIKVLDSGYQLVNYTHVPLVGGEDFSITVGPEDYANGAHFQYGFSVTGVNADPANETALGFAKVSAATASVKDLTKGKVVMYPNPASSMLNISAENAIDTIEVYNLLGQMVLTAKPANNQAALNVSNLTSGVYIVNTTIAGKQTSARFVKQ